MRTTTLAVIVGTLTFVQPAVAAVPDQDPAHRDSVAGFGPPDNPADTITALRARLSAERHRGDVWKDRAGTATRRARLAETATRALRSRIGAILNEAPLRRAEHTVRLAATSFATRTWPAGVLATATRIVTDCEANTFKSNAAAIRSVVARNPILVAGVYYASGRAQMLTVRGSGRGGTWGILAGDYQRAGFTAFDPQAPIFALARAIANGQLHRHYAASGGCWGRRMRAAGLGAWVPR